MKIKFPNVLLAFTAVLASATSFSQCYSPATHCTPTVTNVNSYSIGIQNVTMGSTINNTTVATGLAPNYYDYTNLSVAGSGNSTINFSVRNGTGNTTLIKIYIDYNQDGTFNTTSPELVWTSGTTTANAVVTGSFTIPSGQTAGLYKIRITGDLGSQTTTGPCQLGYGEIEDYTLIVTSSTPDALSFAHTSPSYYIAGNNTIGFSMFNLGDTAMRSVNIGYRLGTNTPVNQSVTGINVAPGTLFTTTFSTQMNLSSTGSYSMKVWLNNVNGAGTQTRQNDTICKTFIVYCSSALNGTYTINPSGSGSNNFTGFGAADTALKSCGISGPVVFNVSSGTYNSSIEFLSISGSSATNTITFIGTGSSNTILTAATTASQPYVVRFNGCSYVNMKNMTIRSTGTTDAWVTHFVNGTNNRLSNCVIEITGTGATSTGANLIPVVVNGNTATLSTQTSIGNNNSVDSCILNTGYYGVYTAMSSVANVFRISYSQILNTYYYAYYSNGNYSPKILNNTIRLRNNNNNNVGVYIINCNNNSTNFIDISGNRITDAGQYGIYMSSCSHSGSAFNKIYNNMIGGGFRSTSTVTGINMNSVNRAQVYHNNINMNNAPSSGINAALSINNGSTNDVRNNHLAITNPLAVNAVPFWVSPTTAVTSLDYNNYYNLSSVYLLNLAGANYSRNGYLVAYPSGGGINSMNLNPFFVSSTDLHTYNGCNKGVNLTSTVANDFDGETRSTPPDIGADEITTKPSTDIGVLKINAPVFPLSAGSKTVNVTIRNYGSNTVTSAVISYSVNGGTAVTQSWSGSLASCDTANVVFSTPFTVGSGGTALKVYTSSPNSTSDGFTPNDTAQYNLCNALNGVYTIGNSGNYPNLTAAVNDLKCGGVTGPVVFSIASGAYNEQVQIPEIIGTSATNSITFQSANGIASSVQVSFNGTAAKNFTFSLFGSNFIKLKNITINALNTTYGVALDISSNASRDSFYNVVLNGVVTTTNSTNHAVVSIPSGVSDFIYFENCSVNNGAYGLYVNSNSVLPNCQNLTVSGCVFKNQYAYGMYNQYLSGLILLNNKITTNSTLTTYMGMRNYWIMIPSDLHRPVITGNSISGAVAGTGMYNQYLGVNSSVTTARRPLIANNMIQIGSAGTATIGIRDLNGYGSDYIHNSVNIGSTLTTNTSAAGYFESTTTSPGSTILNNSFTGSNGAPAIRINTVAAYPTCNYNNLFTTGANLGYTNTTARTTLLLWQTNSTRDANSINVNPYYTSNTDLHSNQALMNNAGTPTSLVSDDFDNQARCPNGGCPGGTSNPDIGADEFIPVALDAALMTVDAPVTICPGSTSYNVLVTIKNIGSSTLTSAQIQWSVNGVAKTGFNWTGSLAQGVSASSINIGSTLFGPGQNVIKVWTSAPNAGTDGNNTNDTVSYSPSSLLSGVYTIGGTSADFPNFTSAVNALNTIGLCGPVTFHVREGVFYEKIQINNVAGSSSTNFITFKTDPLNTWTPEITADGNSVAADNHTIFLNGTRYIAFRDLKISNTSVGTGTYGTAVRFAGLQDSVLFINNIISSPVTTNTGTNFSVFFHGTGAANMINRFILDSNIINNGSYGLYLYGNTTTNASTFEGRHRIRHNQFNGQFYTGIHSQFVRNLEIIGNRIWLSPTSSTGSRGIYMDYNDSFRLERNNINYFGQYGIYLLRANNQWGSGSAVSTVVNNLVGGTSTGTSAYGIYMAASTPGTRFINVFHNSVSVTSTATGSAYFMQQTTSGQYSDMDIRNNSFANYGTGSYTCYFYFGTGTPIPNLTINYNNYFTLATNNLLFVISQNGYTVANGGSPGYNANSRAGNPGYINHLTNLHGARAQLNDVGTNLSSVLIDIDGQTRPMAPSTIVDIGGDEYIPVVLDIGVAQFVTPNICTPSQAINVRVQNYTNKSIDSFKLHWSVDDVLMNEVNVKSTLGGSGSITVNLQSSFSFTGNTTYRFKFWTKLPNGKTDSIPDNDTFRYAFSYFGNAPLPITVNTSQCGQGKAWLRAQSVSGLDSIGWYTSPTGGTYLGLGSSMQGPFITSTTTFYAQAMRLSGHVTLNQGIPNVGVNITQTNLYGGMVNMTLNATVLMDSITVRLWYSLPNNAAYQLYFKSGTYAGFETNPSAWQLLGAGQARYFVLGGQYYARVSTNGMFMAPGNYSFYYTCDLTSGIGNSLYSYNVGLTVSNPELTIFSGGRIVIGLFGSQQVITNYNPYMDFMYKNQCSDPPRSPYTVTVNPKPLAGVRTGSVFEGRFEIGNETSPDVTEVGNTLIYELIPPTGYTDADHGITWAVTNVSARTSGGMSVPSTDYGITPPSGTGPGTLTFVPSSVYLDSVIVFSITLMDLGPYLCDSVVTRHVKVAPTPQTNFIFKNIPCLGEDIIFENLTTIHSGSTTYMWYFGDGDSSDFQNAVHRYRSAGFFNVRLVATSSPWNIVKDTMIQVEVYDVPNVKYRVTNKCQGEAVEFVNQTTILSGSMTYEWNFGDGSPISTQISPNHLYAGVGGYVVNLKVTSSNGCVGSLSKNAYQFARPVPNFSLVSGNCENENFEFSNSTTIAMGQFGNLWNFDDNNAIATVSNPTYKFVNPGSRNVKLKVVSEFGCMDSIVKVIVVKPAPQANFTFPSSCSLTPTEFTNTTVVPSSTVVAAYTWEYSDGGTSNLANPSRLWPSIGPKTVKLHVLLANGCEDEIEKTLSVGVEPLVDFNIPDHCAGETAEVHNSTTWPQGVIEYEWDFSNVLPPSTDRIPSVKFTNTVTSTINITLKATVDGQCSQSVTKAVTVAAMPTTCTFEAIRDYTNGQYGYRYEPQGGAMNGITYKWFTGDGTELNSNGTGTSYNYKWSDKFCITMIATNAGGCSCNFTKCVIPTTGVDDIGSAENGINVYPNPNNGTFVIDASAYGKKVLKAEVYNTIGQIVSVNPGNTDKLDVNISNQPNGVYTVKITTEDGILSRLITVVR